MMRSETSIKNISYSILTQVIMTLLSFISRKIFINSLGMDYLGINGIMTNVISILGLVESGIGSSIVFSLYKPLAEKDERTIISLVQLYKRIYKYIALVVFVISLGIYPFLPMIVKNTDISFLNITIVYFLFVLQNVVSYLYAYKWALINADQRGYILTKMNLLFQIVTTISKIIILKASQSYILYIVIGFLIMLIQVYINGNKVNKLYPYMSNREKVKLEKNIERNIIENVKALFFHNIGNQCIYGTDNMIIGTLINVSTVGIYSNYSMIIGQLFSLIRPIISGISSSVGNLIAVESKEKVYFIFKTTYFVAFWIYSFAIIFLFNLINPFMDWWLGEGFLLNKLTLAIILFNWYIDGLRACVIIYKTRGGAIKQDKYVPIIQGVVNLVASILLAKYIGLLGVVLGSTISFMIIPIWNEPRILYKEVFRKSVRQYFRLLIIYIIIMLLSGGITTMVCNTLFTGYSFLSLIGRGIICILIPNLIYLIIFFRTDEFKYLIDMFKSIILKKFLLKIDDTKEIKNECE